MESQLRKAKAATFFLACVGLISLFWWNHGHAAAKEQPVVSQPEVTTVEQSKEQACHLPIVRVTMFTMEGCPHCTRMKTTMQECVQNAAAHGYELAVEEVHIVPGSPKRQHRRAMQRAEMAQVPGYPTCILYVSGGDREVLIGAVDMEKLLGAAEKLLALHEGAEQEEAA